MTNGQEGGDEDEQREDDPEHGETPRARDARGRRGWSMWCRERDSNPHGLPRSILSRLRLPFRHLGAGADSTRGRRSGGATVRVYQTPPRSARLRGGGGLGARAAQGRARLRDATAARARPGGRARGERRTGARPTLVTGPHEGSPHAHHRGAPVPGLQLRRRHPLRLQDVLGAEARFVWHTERELGPASTRRRPGRLQLRRLPALRSARGAEPRDGRRPRLRARGGPVLGICNGFQILTEAGLLPGRARPERGPRLRLRHRARPRRAPRHAVHLRLRAPAGAAAADRAPRGPLRRRRGDARAARGRGPRGAALRAADGERPAPAATRTARHARHRRHRRRARHRARHDAAPRAGGRTAARLQRRACVPCFADRAAAVAA
jgi:hypothetical protein